MLYNNTGSVTRKIELSRSEIFQFEVDNIIYRWRKGDIFDLMIKDDPSEFQNIFISDIVDIGRVSKFVHITESDTDSKNFMNRYKCYMVHNQKQGLAHHIAHHTIKNMPSKIRESSINKILGDE